jgi:hypothetical protein
LDLSETLKALKQGEALEFQIAGEGAETTYNSLHSTKAQLGLNISILTIDNGLKAIVTAL